jgi:hypothetical protein
VGVWPLSCWDCSVSNPSGIWSVVCCEVKVSAEGPITCPEEFYRWCVWVWPWSLDDVEALAATDCCVTEKNRLGECTCLTKIVICTYCWFQWILQCKEVNLTWEECTKENRQQIRNIIHILTAHFSEMWKRSTGSRKRGRNRGTEEKFVQHICSRTVKTVTKKRFLYMHVQRRHYLVQRDWLLPGSAPAFWQTDDWRRMESTFRGPGGLIP